MDIEIDMVLDATRIYGIKLQEINGLIDEEKI